MDEVLSYAVKTYLKRINIILFFSIPSLLAFLIPLFSPMPTYLAIGGMFVRIGSIKALSGLEIAIILLAFLASLLLFSLAIVAINLVIKAQRTATNIRREVINDLEKYIFGVFWLMIQFTLIVFLIQLVAFEMKWETTVAPVLTFLVTLPLIFAPSGMIIDDLRPYRALGMSIRLIFKNLKYVLLYIVPVFVLISLLEVIFLLALPNRIAEITLVLLNSLFVLPFLLVFFTQVYLTKYTLIK
ncbi:Uncharacterised protein [Candidatus Gugararchaeum adminiculabundum]|nr:Uncharacterised protein [Candidatus Gugararchaeum adminiculabundum]